MSPSNRAHFLAWTTPDEGCVLDGSWNVYAHPHQKFPQTANNGEPWTTWLILGGRGAGKPRGGRLAQGLLIVAILVLIVIALVTFR